jgi:hypothetical protein
MPHYKAPDNSIHCLDEEGFEHLLPQGSVKISYEEALSLSKPPEPSSNELLLRQILELESGVTPRRLREAVAGIDKGWLKDVESQITALRKKIK